MKITTKYVDNSGSQCHNVIIVLKVRTLIESRSTPLSASAL